MITIIIKKKELFDLLQQESHYLSDPIGSAIENTTNRLVETLYINDKDYDFFLTKLYEVGTEILKMIAPYTKDIDNPYFITTSAATNYPDSVIYKLNIPDGVSEGVVIPLVQQAIVESIIKYIITEWLILKKYAYETKLIQYRLSLSNIKTALMFGKKATLKHRTL